MSKRRIRGHLSRDHGSRQSGTSAAEAEAGTGDADDRRATRDSPEALETGDGGLGEASTLLPLGDQVDGVAFVKPETSGRGTDFRTGTEAVCLCVEFGLESSIDRNCPVTGDEEVHGDGGQQSDLMAGSQIHTAPEEGKMQPGGLLEFSL